MPSVLIGQHLAGPNEKAYIITDFLDRGAFGEVYRAKSESTGSVVAVKLLPMGQLSIETDRLALLNEIKTARQINHPNVVQIVHVDEGTNRDLGPYLMMEYISGGTLARLLKVQSQANAQIPLTRALEMMIDVAQGTRAINEKLIHRDIKPNNVLVEGTLLKISDFGISKFVDESTRLHTFKGGQHIAYMAPEGWVNEKNTFKLDVYAVGLLFFEILILKHPFRPQVKDQGSIHEWERIHLYGAIPDLQKEREGLPISLVQLISRMVAKRPQDRPNWDEILRVLSDPGIEPKLTQNIVIAQAVASAVSKQQEVERLNLESARKAQESQRQSLLYGRSCEDLLQRLRPPVEQFNKQFQLGKIEILKEFYGTLFKLPGARIIEVTFFSPQSTRIKIQGGVVIGGGWIGLNGGRSANLVLIKQGDDDLYGHWFLCEIKLMALVDSQKMIGRFGITDRTIQPFGLTEAYFYEQIAYAQGGVHIFTYHFIESVEDYFTGLIAEGCK